MLRGGNTSYPCAFNQRASAGHTVTTDPEDELREVCGETVQLRDVLYPASTRACTLHQRVTALRAGRQETARSAWQSREGTRLISRSSDRCARAEGTPNGTEQDARFATFAIRSTLPSPKHDSNRPHGAQERPPEARGRLRSVSAQPATATPRRSDASQLPTTKATDPARFPVTSFRTAPAARLLCEPLGAGTPTPLVLDGSRPIC
jgi:hypothetical protein